MSEKEKRGGPARFSSFGQTPQEDRASLPRVASKPPLPLLSSVPENFWLKILENFLSLPLLVLRLTYGAQEIQQQLETDGPTALCSALIVRKQSHRSLKVKGAPNH